MIAEDDLEQEIQAYLLDGQWHPNAAEARRAARRVIHQLRERNYILCLRGPHLYGFVHPTFPEYLTAAEYVRRFDKQPQQITIDDLIELFDEHCHEDDWREVLRLICGQIDEEFVGRIVEHLATRTDLEKWDGTSLPELSLAVYCMTEVRGLSRLENAGRRLLQQTITMTTKADASRPDRAFFFDDLLPACRELGNRWPGREELDQLALSHAGEIPISFGEDFWPYFVAHVAENRDAVTSLTRRTKGTTDGAFFRRAAFQALAEKWPDAATRKLLEERAVQDEHKYVRRAALQALAEKWPDEATRKLLEERAVQDEDGYARNLALQALAEKWPDAATRKLLEERAVQDEDEYVRRAALRALAEKWPDEATRELLRERACLDGAAASVVGAEHSAFGRIVFTKHLHTLGPYLDPAEPVSRKQIELAAEMADVPGGEVDETVRSLSAHMGWDITKGAGGGE